MPLGIAALLLAYQYLPKDSLVSKPGKARFDVKGTLLLVLTLAAYSLGMTIGHGSFGQLNMALLLLAALGVGPFYLSGALGLDPARVGLVMSSGPIVAALTGAPAGRLVDRLGTFRTGIAGLFGMVVGASTMSLLPTAFGIPGYVAALMVITGSYALFQAANNTAVMGHIQPEQRGVISGMLNLSRNLGLITGASLMGTVFAMGADTANLLTAPPQALVSGMRITFGVSAVLVSLAITIAYAGQAISRRNAATTPPTHTKAR